MNIKYWNNFSKRENSTLQPADNTAVTVTDVRLKDDTSYLNPTFILTNTHAPTTMTYIQFQGRYYFITDRIKRNNNIVEISCECDVLATYKSAIGSYNAFVERSASNYDNMLYDVEISKKEDSYAITKATTSTGFDSNSSYVVRVVGTNAIKSYVLSKSQFEHLLGTAFTGTANYPISTSLISSDIIKAVFNPFQYIVSVMWFPFNIFTLSSNTPIVLGWYAIDGTSQCKYLTNDSYTKSISLNKPTATYNDFRDYSNDWCTYQLYVPGCGQIGLDASIMKNNSIGAHYSIDLITGVCTCQISSDLNTIEDPSVISTLSGTVGVPIQIGQQGSISSGIVSGITNAGISAASGNYIGAATTIGNTLGSALQPSVSVAGAQGTMAAIKEFDKFVITKTTKKSASIPTTEMGRPLYQNVTLNTLSGFIKCANASISIDGFKSERDKINSYLNSGFYYE